jgi:hypothetical protein
MPAAVAARIVLVLPVAKMTRLLAKRNQRGTEFAPGIRADPDCLSGLAGAVHPGDASDHAARARSRQLHPLTWPGS